MIEPGTPFLARKAVRVSHFEGYGICSHSRGACAVAPYKGSEQRVTEHWLPVPRLSPPTETRLNGFAAYKSGGEITPGNTDPHLYTATSFDP